MRKLTIALLLAALVPSAGCARRLTGPESGDLPGPCGVYYLNNHTISDTNFYTIISYD